MRRIAFFIISICSIVACQDAMIQGPEIPADEMKNRIEVFMPDAERVNVYSTATTSENTIDTIWVLAFNGSTPKWVEKIPGSQIMRNGYASQLLPQLTNEPLDGDIIVCIANVDPNPDTATVTYATINDCFPVGGINGYYHGTEYLPMYGDFVWSSSSGYTCVMVRAVAKIQVQMGASVPDVTGNFPANFTTQNVLFKALNGAWEGRIKPASPMEYVSCDPIHHYIISEEFYLTQKENVTEKESNLYLYEYPSSNIDYEGTSIYDTAFVPKRQHLILHKVNAPADTSYYRLDFYDPIAKKFLDTKRNHHYLFTINKVRSEGYRTLVEALENPGSNIEYTIQVNDESKQVISNGQYAIVADIDTTTHYITSPTPYVIGSARFHLPPEILSSGYFDFTVNSISLDVSSGALILAAPYPLELTSSPQDIRVVLTTPTAEATLVIQLGNITFRAPLKFVSI